MTQATQLLGVQSLADFAHDYGVEYAWNVYGPQRLHEEPIVDLPVAGSPSSFGVHAARGHNWPIGLGIPSRERSAGCGP